ncbi:hypothetical protein Van01_34990 [Micromonospora andamanensis]|uniref:Uncharacterized protein n=1 Tax=Micromonospora andamanensis TaxID=1287068 RepID=A0ABQ4HXA8_9ACTN|nr:hypothetical protein Van01_34990 [Micromonospora andamanensis]
MSADRSVAASRRPATPPDRGLYTQQQSTEHQECSGSEEFVAIAHVGGRRRRPLVAGSADRTHGHVADVEEPDRNLIARRGQVIRSWLSWGTSRAAVSKSASW